MKVRLLFNGERRIARNAVSVDVLSRYRVHTCDTSGKCMMVLPGKRYRRPCHPALLSRDFSRWRLRHSRCCCDVEENFLWYEIGMLRKCMRCVRM
jgi:hypothetical protein